MVGGGKSSGECSRRAHLNFHVVVSIAEIARPHTSARVGICDNRRVVAQHSAAHTALDTLTRVNRAVLPEAAEFDGDDVGVNLLLDFALRSSHHASRRNSLLVNEFEFPSLHRRRRRLRRRHLRGGFFLLFRWTKEPVEKPCGAFRWCRWRWRGNRFLWRSHESGLRSCFSFTGTVAESAVVLRLE